MSSKFTVSEFVVEMGFDPSKVERGLSQLDKRVMQAATHIEKKLNSAFSRLNGAQKTGDMFKQIQRQADQTSNHIQKALQRGFAVGGVGGGLFARYEREGVNAANTVRDAMREASRSAGAHAGNPRPYTPRPRQGFSGADSINDIVHRQQNSSFSGNMALRNAEQHSQYQTRLTALRDHHLSSGADVNAFRRGLRELNYEFAQTMRQASIARSQQRLNALEGSGSLSRLSSAATSLAVGFLSLQKAVEFFGESLREGAGRQQASTMLRTAYGDNAKIITEAIDAYVDKYGADRLEARKQAAVLRQTMPKSLFSDEDIPKLLETESVFAHQTGMDNEAVGRLNYAFSQIATSAHLMGQDFLQVVNASPALITQLQQLKGFKSSRDLREYYKNQSGAQFVKDANLAMELLNKRTKADVAAQNNIKAVQGRYNNSVKDAQEDFFKGFESGFRNFLVSITGLINDNGDTFETLGKWLGSFFNTLASAVYNLDNIIMTLKAYYADFEDLWTSFFEGLPKPVQRSLTEVGDIITAFLKGVSEAALLYMGVGAAGKGVGFLARMAGMSGAGVAGAGVSGGFLASIVPVVVAAVASYLIAKPIGDATFNAIKDHNDEAYGEDKIAGGNLYKNSPLGKAYTWLNEQFSDVPANWNQFKNAPLLPGLSATAPQLPSESKVSVQIAPVQFQPLTLNIPMPDGSTYTTTAQVIDMISGREASVMMSAQGLGGGWQSPGQNAGFSPSSLKR